MKKRNVVLKMTNSIVAFLCETVLIYVCCMYLQRMNPLIAVYAMVMGSCVVALVYCAVGKHVSSCYENVYYMPVNKQYTLDDEKLLQSLQMYLNERNILLMHKDTMLLKELCCQAFLNEGLKNCGKSEELWKLFEEETQFFIDYLKRNEFRKEYC